MSGIVKMVSTLSLTINKIYDLLDNKLVKNKLQTKSVYSHYQILKKLSNRQLQTGKLGELLVLLNDLSEGRTFFGF